MPSDDRTVTTDPQRRQRLLDVVVLGPHEVGTSNGDSPKNPPAPASSSVRIDRSTTPIEAFETPPFSSSTALPWSHVGLEVLVHG